MEEVQKLWDFSVVETKLRRKSIKASDIEQVDGNTTRLRIQQCNSEEWERVGAAICKLPNIRTLGVFDCQSGDTLACSLAHNLLTHLTMSKVGITPNGIESIAKDLPNLTFLDFKSNELGKAAIEIITKNFRKLTALSIENNQSIGDEGVALIAAGLAGLRVLHVDKCGVTDKGVEAIAKDLPNLKRLCLNSNAGVTYKGALAISKLKNLTSLGISNTNIGKQGVATIAGNLGKLEEFATIGIKIEEEAEAIARGLPLLKQLWIHGCGIKEAGAITIAKSLHNLTTLWIGANEIGNRGAFAISENLSRLDILQIDNCGIEDEAALQLAHRLTNLKTISISSKMNYPEKNKLSENIKLRVKQLLPAANLLLM